MSTLRAEIIRRLTYLLTASALILSQNLVALIAWQAYRPRRPLDLEFWLLPLKATLEIWSLPAIWGAAIFAYCLLVAWALALLSFRLAQRANRGFVLAVLSVVPIVQAGAILLNALWPSDAYPDENAAEQKQTARGIALGLLSGVGLIVLAVLVSAVTFGAYGWGLFVMSPFLVGITTGYLVNAKGDLGGHETMKLAVLAAGLGSLALVVLALEGIACILLATPLALPVVMIGGLLGRGLARARLRQRNPLVSVAILPLVFLMEAVIPPEAPISTQYDITIAAPPEKVWQALTSSEPIRTAPGLSALAGLAYPISSRLDGEGVGAERIGAFSTGDAREQVTVWERNRALAFNVRHQPPAMEEMSPYRRVHAPHVEGYFITGETRFDLLPLPQGQTRLRVTSDHRLRIAPAPYWKPIARLAIRHNVGRVLQDIKAKSENPVTVEAQAGDHRRALR